MQLLQVGFVPVSLRTCIGDTQCCLRDELAGIGTFDEPCQIDERGDPNSAGLEARSQFVKKLLGEFGREPR